MADLERKDSALLAGEPALAGVVYNIIFAAGASPLHEIVWGVIPQVAPLWTSFALYRFESNSRAATVLGLIGAGGIGGFFEKTFAPKGLGRIYDELLTNLKVQVESNG